MGDEVRDIDGEIRTLLDKQAIYELMCRYCRGADRLDRDAILACFWPGAIDVHVGGDGSIHRGTAEEFFAEQWSGFEEFTASQHYVCNMIIEIQGDIAVAETYQFSFFWKEPGTDPGMNFLNSNRYADIFERRNGEWRILRRDFIRNFTVPIAPERFPTLENGWIMPIRGRDDIGYRSVSDVQHLIGHEVGR